MSLPPLLLARLKQRGIIKENAEDSEEVFAESYDKEDDNDQVDASEKFRGGAPGCPNKYNHYHICTDFCFDHWREGYPEERLSQKYLEERSKMLKQYPLPTGWKEVYDAGMRRHYYWCQASDEVSWLSPKHPRAVISEAAAKIAKEMYESVRGSALPYSKRSGNREIGDRSEDSSRDRNRRDHGKERYKGKDPEREARRRKRDNSESEEERQGSDNDAEAEELSERQKLRRAKRRGIDPMDPAAYGDAPTGAWSTGLSSDGVKTGVDVTASGPLFQSRPYPAPGAILRRNNPNQDKKD